MKFIVALPAVPMLIGCKRTAVRIYIFLKLHACFTRAYYSRTSSKVLPTPLLGHLPTLNLNPLVSRITDLSVLMHVPADARIYVGHAHTHAQANLVQLTSAACMLKSRCFPRSFPRSSSSPHLPVTPAQLMHETCTFLYPSRSHTCTSKPRSSNFCSPPQ